MKKILSLILVAAMLICGAVALSACNNGNELVMATNATFPPYESVKNGKYVGIDIEIAQAIADKLGMTLRIENTEFDSIIGGVQTGKYDMGMAGMTVTPERQENVDFSKTYATGVQVFIVREDATYTCYEDFLNAEGTATLDDVKIGVQQGTTGDIYASDTVAKWGFGEDHVIKYKNGPDAVAALLQGKVEAVIIDNAPAEAYVAANAGLKILEAAYAEEDYAICVKKGNTELLNKINTALDELIADGTVAAIIEKYIPSDGE